MEKLQIREKEIFETLKKIKNIKSVIIGGYAVNPYTIPRFSVDCDIVLKDEDELKKLLKILEENGYIKKPTPKVDLPYHGDFIRYEKDVIENIDASFDILFKEVFGRNDKVSFNADWIFENSSLILLKGKTITDKIKLRVINIDALIVMKFISCRETDIRDIFMLTSKAKDPKWIKDEIIKKYNFDEKFKKIKDKIISKDFKNNLQGVYGKIDEITFERYKKALLNLG
ncbi:MAG: hypothetical protein AABX61_00785 [Nanoarchaeota archaeon]